MALTDGVVRNALVAESGNADTEGNETDEREGDPDTAEVPRSLRSRTTGDRVVGLFLVVGFPVAADEEGLGGEEPDATHHHETAEGQEDRRGSAAALDLTHVLHVEDGAAVDGHDLGDGRAVLALDL